MAKRAESLSTTITRHKAPYPAIDPTLPALSAKGKIILITGGGQGIGLSIALGFAKANASHIVLLGRTLATLTYGKTKISQLYPSTNIHTIVADITDPPVISAVFAKIHNEIGRISICVSNASYLSAIIPIASVSLDDWFRSYEVMVKGGLTVAQEFLKHRTEKDAAFINISSSVAQMDYVPGFSAYASAKVAMGAAMQYLQAENEDVRVVSVHLGIIESDMSRGTQKEFGVEFEFDDYELPGHFCVWITSSEADFLGGRYVWAAWDVEELVARKEEILERDILRFGLLG